MAERSSARQDAAAEGPGQFSTAAEGPGQFSTAAEGPGQFSTAAEGPGQFSTVRGGSPPGSPAPLHWSPAPPPSEPP
ncbi:MAG: hypothetical protein JO345_14285 [Streptosporangiaceae bacterium]|nr:hypothetical protein [Streptosporangiaceae bacterium]